MAIDTHAHINSLVLKDVKEEIQRVLNTNYLENIINVSLDLNTSKEIIKISEENKKIYRTVGIHPLYIKEDNLDQIYKLINERVVAIGEIGLDTTKNNYDEQKRFLIRQIMIANEVCLPVIIHANNTNTEIIEIFKKYVKPKYGCVFHCFQPDLEVLKYLIDEGIYISFAGRVTYKNAKKSLEVAKTVPNELFLVETDSPYISPEPLRESTNNSTNIKYIIERLAQIKQTTYDEIDRISTENAKRLFKKIGDSYEKK